MATELDHNTIKDKIVAILKANAGLFTTTAEVDKLRKITTGFPPGNEMQDEMIPYAYVTNGTGPFETITPQGIAISNSIEGLAHTIHYDITIVVNKADSRKSELLLDALQKLVLETLEADTTLTGIGTADVDKSFPVRVDHLRAPGVELGSTLKGRIVTIRCFKVTS